MSKQKKPVPTRVEVFDDFVDPPDAQVSSSPISKDELDTSDWFQEAEKRPRRVAMTFTLDPNVIELIEQAAGKHRLSRSRIIEKIAMKTLG